MAGDMIRASFGRTGNQLRCCFPTLGCLTNKCRRWFLVSQELSPLWGVARYAFSLILVWYLFSSLCHVPLDPKKAGFTAFV